MPIHAAKAFVLVLPWWMDVRSVIAPPSDAELLDYRLRAALTAEPPRTTSVGWEHPLTGSRYLLRYGPIEPSCMATRALSQAVTDRRFAASARDALAYVGFVPSADDEDLALQTIHAIVAPGLTLADDDGHSFGVGARVVPERSFAHCASVSYRLRF